MAVAGPVLLCSDGLAALAALREARGLERAVLVPDAAAPLEDGEAIVARDARRLRALGLGVEQVAAADLPAVDADVVVVGGGDPFHLLRTVRATGAAGRLRDAVARGVAYVGLSAGALVAGPDLAPVRLSSPFAPAPGQDLRGLGLAPVVALPHHERPGRAARHREALAAFGHRWPIVPLADDDAVVVVDGIPALDGPQRGLRLRSAVPGDVDAIVRTGGAAWRPVPAGHTMLVAARDGQVVGFAHVDSGAGRLTRVFTDPAVSDDGTSGALRALAQDVLRHGR